MAARVSPAPEPPGRADDGARPNTKARLAGGVRASPVVAARRSSLGARRNDANSGLEVDAMPCRAVGYCQAGEALSLVVAAGRFVLGTRGLTAALEATGPWGLEAGVTRCRGSASSSPRTPPRCLGLQRCVLRDLRDGSLACWRRTPPVQGLTPRIRGRRSWAVSTADGDRVSYTNRACTVGACGFPRVLTRSAPKTQG